MQADGNSHEAKRDLPAYYYLQPSKNGDDDAEEELYDSNGTLITSEYLNDAVAKSMTDRYTVEYDSSHNPQYRCNKCKKILHSTGHLIAHIVVHTGENPYECSLCQRCFANSTRLKLHLKVHCIKKLHPGLTVTRISKGASSSTSIPSTKSDVDLNEINAPANSTNFCCTECHEMLPKDTLYLHMKQHLQEKANLDKATHKCDRCGEEFDQKLALQQHQESCRSPIKVSSEVDLVPITSPAGSGNFKKQIESNPILSGLLMRERQEPPPISVTTIELDTQEQEPHEDSPEAESEPNPPEIIPHPPEPNTSATGGGFVISSVTTVDEQFLETLAQMELQARSPELEEVPTMDSTVAAASLPSNTTCGLCGKCFSENFGLRQHMRIMHKDTKPYKCPECKKSFAKEQSLLIHLRVHISNRPFICIICHKTFTRAAALNGHLSSHSHESVKCFGCDEVLPQVQKYAFHIETRHPQFPEVFQRIRVENPEHGRARVIRHLLLRNISTVPEDSAVPSHSITVDNE